MFYLLKHKINRDRDNDIYLSEIKINDKQLYFSVMKLFLKIINVDIA